MAVVECDLVRGRGGQITDVDVTLFIDKTIVVEVNWLAKEPKYKKYLRKQTRLYAHDERGECQIGDHVEIIETRPLSKLKRWRLLRKL